DARVRGEARGGGASTAGPAQRPADARGPGVRRGGVSAVAKSIPARPHFGAGGGGAGRRPAHTPGGAGEVVSAGGLRRACPPAKNNFPRAQPIGAFSPLGKIGNSTVLVTV